MRVLIVHSAYGGGSPSGENETVQSIVNCARSQGVTLRTAIKSTDELASSSRMKRLRIATDFVVGSRGGLREIVDSWRPDLIQVHNPTPFFGARQLRALQRKIPIVHVIHNYRHSCIKGTHFRAGAECVLCRDGRLRHLNGVTNRCYRQSRIQSGVMALSEGFNGKEWRSLEHYVAISDYVKRYLIDQNFPESRITHIPNPIDRISSGAGREDLSEPGAFIFVGRLTREKGIELLLDAWAAVRNIDDRARRLDIVGAGELEGLVREHAATDSSIVFHGRLDRNSMQKVNRRSRISLIPSLWDEPFGRVAAEALAEGRGIVTTGLGGLGEFNFPGCSWHADRTTEGFSNAMVESLASSSDVHKSAEAAWLFNYSPQVISSKYVALWRRVLSGC